MKHEWPAPLSSGSLLPPRPTLPEAALALHGAQPSFALQASHSSHTTLGRIVWSVAEAVVGIPIEKWDSAKVGICVEKTRFDAFRPLNATLSAGLAFANALLTEGMRCGLDQDLIAQIAGEEPEARDEELPEFSWDMVRFNTVAGMGREVIGLTAQRSVELAAKPRLSSGAYREILTHVPKKAKHVYTQECRTCVPASKWAMGARAAGSKVVRVGAIFYLTRAATVWFGDVAVDAIQLARGKLSTSKFASNLGLKLVKHSLAGVLSYLLAMGIPFLYPHFVTFLLSDLAANTVADTLTAYLGEIE